MTIRRFSITALAGIVILAVTAALGGCTVAATEPTDALIGAWQVTAAGAVYPPHLFMFDPGFTMLSTNPTNVQERASAPHGGTNDSVGMGTWASIGPGRYRGTFQELNAFATTHAQTGTLTVTFTLTLDGNSFSGTAEATQDGQTHPATLTGTRIAMPEP